MLGDLGAEVLKVERPGAGDETRAWGPPFAGQLSAYYLSCNRNKRALTLDLSMPEGLDLFYDLVRASDVLLENFRAASADRLGLRPGEAAGGQSAAGRLLHFRFRPDRAAAAICPAMTLPSRP